MLYFACSGEFFELPRAQYKRYEDALSRTGTAVVTNTLILAGVGVMCTTFALWALAVFVVATQDWSTDLCLIGAKRGALSLWTAFAAGNLMEQLVMHQRSQIEIRRKDIACMAPLEWLNDEVINLYMSLLLERDMRRRILVCTLSNSNYFHC